MANNIQFNDNGQFTHLCNDFKRALPSALAKSLNTIAFNVMRDVKSAVLPSKLTLRNKFTQSQFQVETASRSNFKATVGFTDKAKYMVNLNEVSVEHPKSGSRYIPIPLPAARVSGSPKRLVSKPKSIKFLMSYASRTGTIIRTIKGDKYIVMVKKKKFIPLYLLKPETHYDGHHFKFEQLIYQSAQRNHFEQILMKALMDATARRR